MHFTAGTDQNIVEHEDLIHTDSHVYSWKSFQLAGKDWSILRHVNMLFYAKGLGNCVRCKFIYIFV